MWRMRRQYADKDHLRQMSVFVGMASEFSGYARIKVAACCIYKSLREEEPAVVATALALI